MSSTVKKVKDDRSSTSIALIRLLETIRISNFAHLYIVGGILVNLLHEMQISRKYGIVEISTGISVSRLFAKWSVVSFVAMLNPLGMIVNRLKLMLI